jgi:RsmE family RNA methyltransferase
VNLLLIEPCEVDAAGVVVLIDERARHLRSVLHVTPGQQLRAGLVDGPVGTAIVRASDDRAVTLECRFTELPPTATVDLLLAVPRPKVLRRLWPQLAALGVGRVLLTNAERVERNYFDTHFLRPDVYRRLLLDGLEQARDTRVPTVTVHRQFRRLVEDELDTETSADLRLVADPAHDASMLTAVPPHARRLLLAVGPEGGWNRFELDLLAAHGFAGISLGTRVLRSDTACVALLAVAHEALRVRAAG